MPGFVFSHTFCDFLFKNWNVSSTQGLVGVCLSVTALSTLLVVLKRVHADLAEKFDRRRTVVADGSPRPFENEPVVTSKRKRLCYLGVCSSVYLVQLALEYFLMLCVMTFNGALFVGVVVGSCVGYLVVGPEIWTKLVVHDDSFTSTLSTVASTPTSSLEPEIS